MGWGGGDWVEERAAGTLRNLQAPAGTRRQCSGSRAVGSKTLTAPALRWAMAKRRHVRRCPAVQRNPHPANPIVRTWRVAC